MESVSLVVSVTSAAYCESITSTFVFPLLLSYLIFWSFNRCHLVLSVLLYNRSRSSPLIRVCLQSSGEGMFHCLMWSDVLWNLRGGVQDHCSGRHRPPGGWVMEYRASELQDYPIIHCAHGGSVRHWTGQSANRQVILQHNLKIPELLLQFPCLSVASDFIALYLIAFHRSRSV